MPKPIPPPHPGETISEDFLKPLNMSVNQLAKALGVTAGSGMQENPRPR
jgi:plasmid maintenance system antidote protein VapI